MDWFIRLLISESDSGGYTIMKPVFSCWLLVVREIEEKLC